MQNSSNNYTPSIKYALAFSRIENHYFINKGFLKEENYILKNIVKLKDIPGIIIREDIWFAHQIQLINYMMLGQNQN